VAAVIEKQCLFEQLGPAIQQARAGRS